jgi:mRNA interferase RelE/StbE
MFIIRFTDEAIKDWRKLDNSIKSELMKNLQPQLENPALESARLKGVLGNCYKVRASVTGYRLVYRIVDDVLVILVIAVGKREDAEVYKSAVAKKLAPNRPIRDRGGEALKRLKADPEMAKEIATLSKGWIEEDRKYLENIPAIKKAAELTQSEVAKKLGMAQAGVSRLENQGDMLLSTLGKYLEAVGEHPRLVVEINGEDYELDLGALAENLH